MYNRLSTRILCLLDKRYRALALGSKLLSNSQILPSSLYFRLTTVSESKDFLTINELAESSLYPQLIKSACQSWPTTIS